MNKTVRMLLGAALVAGTLAFGGGAAEAAPLTCQGQRVTIKGSNGPDVIKGTKGRDVIHGQGGNDRIYGNGGSDIICGGGGSDRIWGGNGNDRLNGNFGHDAIWGEEGTDHLNGSRGNDLLDGGPGSNPVLAGPGVDTCLRVTTSKKSKCEPTSIARQFPLAAGSSSYWYGDSSDSPRTVTVNAKKYRNSLYRGSLDDDTGWTAVSFDLGRKYKRLVATVGWLDASTDVEMSGLFAVYGDGPDPLWEGEVAFGTSKTIKVDVTGVLRLWLGFDPSNAPSGNDADGYGAFGSPYVSANKWMQPQR